MARQHYSVFIGRFQPFHKGHYAVVKKALEQTDKLILVLGSCNRVLNTRNPLSLAERERIISKSLTEDERNRVIFTGVSDYVYNLDKWIAAVQTAVFNAVHRTWTADGYDISLIGMHKDNTSFYLNLFPSWESIEVPPVTKENLLSSTHVRFQKFDSFESQLGRERESFVTDAAFEEWQTIMSPENVAKFKAEFAYEKKYQEVWGSWPARHS